MLGFLTWHCIQENYKLESVGPVQFVDGPVAGGNFS
jgi:hypothetical protein